MYVPRMYMGVVCVCVCVFVCVCVRILTVLSVHAVWEYGCAHSCMCLVWF